MVKGDTVQVGETEEVQEGEMVNDQLNGAPSTPINSINLETLANSGSESEVIFDGVI